MDSSWKSVTDFAGSRTSDNTVGAEDAGSKPPPTPGRLVQTNSRGREHLCIGIVGGAVLCD